MQILLKTYLEIIALRKGPEVIPVSWLVLVVSLVLLALFWLLQLSVVELQAPQIVAALVGYVLALAFYGAVVYLTGHGARILPTLSAIIACGSIISAVALLESLIMRNVVGEGVAADVAFLIWFWSVPVKGHVVARTIQQHWLVGITIAMSAFILRLGVQAAFVAPA